MKAKNLTLVLLAALSCVLAVFWQDLYKEKFLKVAYPEGYKNLVTQNARENGVDPYLIYAVIKNESGFNPDAQSDIGAVGLMQMTPDTFQWAQMLRPGQTNYTASELVRPEINIRYGTVVLESLLKEFGSEQTALAAYHAGRGNVKKWLSDSRYSPDGRTLTEIPFRDTRVYVGRVIKAQEMYHKIYD